MLMCARSSCWYALPQLAQQRLSEHQEKVMEQKKQKRQFIEEFCRSTGKKQLIVVGQPSVAHVTWSSTGLDVWVNWDAWMNTERCGTFLIGLFAVSDGLISCGCRGLHV